METRVTFATQVTLFCEPQSKHIEVNRKGRPQTKRCLILLTEPLRDWRLNFREVICTSLYQVQMAGD